MKKFILSLLLLFTCISLSSCSGFMGDDEELIIKNISQEIGKNEKGEDGFYIIIEYDSDYRKPDKFFVASGKKGDIGEIGNGIESIVPSIDEETKVTTITINFTDKNMPPVVHKISPGISIKEIHTNQIESGDTEIQVEFSDGSLSDKFIIPKGETGSQFDKYELNTDSKTGEITLLLYFTNKVDPVAVKIPKGDQGIGIESITPGYDEDTYEYTLMIQTTDGNREVIRYSRPNTWIKGTGVPEVMLGIDGDFFYDLQASIIYVKEDGNWVKLVELNQQQVDCEVKYDLNDNDGPEKAYGIDKKTVIVKKGMFVGQDGTSKLPIPLRNGYEFDGWFLTREQNINSGQFTDTTPVNADITLYAKWIKK